jgi:hypothetical protein
VKNLLLFIIALLGLSTCFAQDTVEVRNKLTDSVIERFYVLKANNKIKQGPYRAYFKRKITVAAGRYANDKRVGTWSFYETDGRLVEKYNYDTSDFLYEAPLKRNTHIGFLFDKNIGKTDTLTRPVKIGGGYFSFVPYVTLFRVPFDTYDISTYLFDVYIELLVSPLGRLADYKVHLNSPYYQYSRVFNLDVKLFSEADRMFLPATVNHQPALCRVIIRCTLNDNGSLDLY